MDAKDLELEKLVIAEPIGLTFHELDLGIGAFQGAVKIEYASDLASFVGHMRERGIDPVQVTGDDLRLCKAALLADGKTTATVVRTLSVLRRYWQGYSGDPDRASARWWPEGEVRLVSEKKLEPKQNGCRFPGRIALGEFSN